MKTNMKKRQGGQNTAPHSITINVQYPLLNEIQSFANSIEVENRTDEKPCYINLSLKVEADGKVSDFLNFEQKAWGNAKKFVLKCTSGQSGLVYVVNGNRNLLSAEGRGLVVTERSKPTMKSGGGAALFGYRNGQWVWETINEC